ncbi:response regulator transcription factor [Paraburkholderia sp. MMS20-SJTR3]|uniref:Response regulator transcription factor n=1 Tax=Paraburkholderia sejongensis TaxID=2886946 RepID=A0ABS8JQ47_9BURK|nr:response regulator transcription factor [Paraburkholderia sp. MMS20-SJTR3]MCC8392018.1 response regulator transcription factor [Paraburkholderia sp. MMS20-SJTR3]
MANLRIILADDHPFALLGFRSTLAACKDISIVGEAPTPTALLALLLRTPCDVLVVDLSMPETPGVEEDGVDLIKRIRNTRPALRLLVMTAQTNPAILRTVAADGTVSLYSKSDSLAELPDAIRACARGGRHLSPSMSVALERAYRDGSMLVGALLLTKRQSEILRRLVDGETIDEIALALGCRRRAVANQKREAMARLGVRDEAALFSRIRSNGMLFHWRERES